MSNSTLAIAIDLVSHAYQTNDPILISEKIYEDLKICVTIHEVSDYLDINKIEDYEKVSNEIQYYSITNN